MREVSAVIAGAAVRYWLMEQDGPGVLVLLHGLGSDHNGLTELAERVTARSVVIPDLPGFGASAPLPGRNSLVAYAAFVDALRRHLGVDRVGVAGHSLGASIALVHAGRYPESVDALALFNPVTGVSGFASQLSRAYYDIGAGLPASLARAWLTSRAAVWVADQFIMRTSDPARRRAILAQDYVAYRRADLRAVQESFRSYYDTDFAGYAGRVTAPTLLITGGRDGLAPPTSVRRLGEAMPAAGGVRLVLDDRAGHLFPAEDPDAAGALLDDFLIDRRSPVDNAERAL
jgi:pimeloyl-ACP methyl ester carboxylesterase